MRGTVEELLSRFSPEVGAIAERLRALLFEALPNAIEYVDLADNIIGVGFSERMRDLIFAIAPHRSHVNLQFADGAVLPDPDGLMEGTGKRIRHVKNRTAEDVDRPAMRGLVDAAIAARR